MPDHVAINTIYLLIAVVVIIFLGIGVSILWRKKSDLEKHRNILKDRLDIAEALLDVKGIKIDYEVIRNLCRKVIIYWGKKSTIDRIIEREKFFEIGSGRYIYKFGEEYYLFRIAKSDVFLNLRSLGTLGLTGNIVFFNFGNIENIYTKNQLSACLLKIGERCGISVENILQKTEELYAEICKLKAKTKGD